MRRAMPPLPQCVMAWCLIKQGTRVHGVVLRWAPTKRQTRDVTRDRRQTEQDTAWTHTRRCSRPRRTDGLTDWLTVSFKVTQLRWAQSLTGHSRCALYACLTLIITTYNSEALCFRLDLNRRTFITGKVKGTAVPVHHPHEAVWGSGSIVPCILNLGTRLRWVISFTHRPFYSQYTLDRRPAPEPVWTRWRRGKISFPPLSRIESRSFSP